MSFAECTCGLTGGCQMCRGRVTPVFTPAVCTWMIVASAAKVEAVMTLVAEWSPADRAELHRRLGMWL